MKQRCECGCWIYVEEGGTYNCQECGKPQFIKEEETK